MPWSQCQCECSWRTPHYLYVIPLLPRYANWSVCKQIRIMLPKEEADESQSPLSCMGVTVVLCVVQCHAFSNNTSQFMAYMTTILSDAIINSNFFWHYLHVQVVRQWLLVIQIQQHCHKQSKSYAKIQSLLQWRALPLNDAQLPMGHSFCNR